MDDRRPHPRSPRGGRSARLLLYLPPPLWVGCVLLLSRIAPHDIDLEPLLIATPAVACAASGRRLCVIMAGCSASFVLLPVGGLAGDALPLRLGIALAIGVASMLSFLLARRRMREVGTLADVQRVAEAVQRVLLPPLPPRVGPLGVAVRYDAAARSARVGGDLYEVLETLHGVRIIVGDVRGSGLEAVELAAAVLGPFREAAYDEPELIDVVGRMERGVSRALADPRRRLTDPGDAGGFWADVGEDFVTAVVLELRGDNEPELHAISCGHPPPFLRTASGEVTTVEATQTRPPLGFGDLFVFPPTHADQPDAPDDEAPPPAQRLKPDDELLLYTDGVSEARNAAGAFFPVATAFADLPAEATVDTRLTALHRALHRHLHRRRFRDDATLLLLRVVGDRAAVAAD